MQDTNYETLELCVDFLNDYYREDIATLAQKYPNDQSSLWVDFGDLYSFNPDLADDTRNHPGQMQDVLQDALDMVDLPVDVDLSAATVRIHNLNEEHVYAPGEIRNEQAQSLVGIRGTLERVTTTSDLPDILAWKCGQCMTNTRVPQDPTASELQEPYECQACERQGPFEIDHDQSEWSDYAKLRIESRPDTSENQDGKITGYVLNDLIDVGGDSGLMGRAGEPVTVYGVVQRVQKNGRGENELLFDHVLEAKSIEFDRNKETVEIEDHREEFEKLAAQPDAVDRFAESIAPNLHATDAWEVAMEFAVAYLFGAPRVDIPNGPTYRGDLHFLIIGDFGTGKSNFKSDIEAYSPKCISKSTTALSSGVGLTAAAVKDDFGEGQWTIKPGLLVRANGGHLLLDEIDKGPEELTEMNDAIEGEQVVDVEKAGKSPTYESKTGLMALGNPVEGRFNPNEPIAAQLGIDETLLSRFDGIVTMRDSVDMEQDKLVAETHGKAYTEAQQKEYEGRDSVDILDRPVPIDTGQAWIKYARENVNPILRYEQFEGLKEWYAEEVRQLNHDFAGSDEGKDMPVPANVRVLNAAMKMAIAFARARLQEEVKPQQIKRAKKLGKKLVKQNWNGEAFDANKNYGGKDQMQERVDAIVDSCGGMTLTVSDVADQVKYDYDTVRDTLEKMREADSVANGRYEIKEIMG